MTDQDLDALAGIATIAALVALIAVCAVVGLAVGGLLHWAAAHG